MAVDGVSVQSVVGTLHDDPALHGEALQPVATGARHDDARAEAAAVHHRPVRHTRPCPLHHQTVGQGSVHVRVRTRDLEAT
jgi:hypothetical protein